MLEDEDVIFDEWGSPHDDDGSDDGSPHDDDGSPQFEYEAILSQAVVEDGSPCEDGDDDGSANDDG
jgi:hypothetical protein